MGNELASVEEMDEGLRTVFPKPQLPSPEQLESGVEQAFGSIRRARAKADRDAEDFIKTGGSTTRFSFSDTDVPGTDLERRLFLDAVRSKVEARTVEQIGGEPGMFRSLGRGVEDLAIGGASILAGALGEKSATHAAAGVAGARQIIQESQSRDEGFVERGLQNIARMLPSIALAVGTGGGSGAIGIYATQELPNALVASLDAGLTLEQAQHTAAVSAVVTGVLEEKLLSTKQLAGFAPTAKDGARAAIANYFKQTGKKGLIEFGEEQVQGIAQIGILGASRALAGQDGGQIAIDAIEQVKQQIEQMPETAVSTLGMAGIGQGVQSYRDYKASPDSMSRDMRDYLDSTRVSREAQDFPGVPVRNADAASNAEAIREKRVSREQANADKKQAEADEAARQIHEYERTPQGFAEMHPTRVSAVLDLLSDTPPSRSAFQEAVGLDRLRMNAEDRMRFVTELAAMQVQQEPESTPDSTPSKGERRDEAAAQAQEFARQEMREHLLGYDVPASAIAAIDASSLDQMIADDLAVREFVQTYDGAINEGASVDRAARRAAAQMRLLSRQTEDTPVEQPTEIARQEAAKAEQVEKVLNDAATVEGMSPGELQATANQLAELLETTVPKAPKGQAKKKRQNFLRNFIREKRNELMGRRQKPPAESKSPRGDLKESEAKSPAKEPAPEVATTSQKSDLMTLDELNDLAEKNADLRGDPEFELDLREARIAILERTAIDAYKPLEIGDTVRFTPPRAAKKKWGKVRNVQSENQETGERVLLVHVTDQHGVLKQRPKGKQKGRVDYDMPEHALERPKGVQVQQDNWQEMKDVFVQGSDDYKEAIKAATRVRDFGEIMSGVAISSDGGDRINSMARSAAVKAGLRRIEDELGLKDGTLDSMAMRALHEPDIKLFAEMEYPDEGFSVWPELEDARNAATGGGGAYDFDESYQWDDGIDFKISEGAAHRIESGPPGALGAIQPEMGLLATPAEQVLEMNDDLRRSTPDEALKKGWYTQIRKWLYGTAADKTWRMIKMGGDAKADAQMLVAENIARHLRILMEKQYPIDSNKRGDFKRAEQVQRQERERDEAMQVIHYSLMTHGKLTDPLVPVPPNLKARLNALGPEIRDLIKLLRYEVDAGVLEGMGLKMIPAPMKKTFFEGAGSYLHRTYKLFDPAENWNYNTVLESKPELIKNALEWVMTTYERQPTETKQDHRDRSILILQTLLDAERAGDWLLGKISIGGISTVSLMNRKLDPIKDAAIMEAMGYVRDPSEAFLRTREQQIQMITSYRMQEKLAEMGIAMGLLHETQQHPNQIQLFKDNWSIHKDEHGEVESSRIQTNRKFYPLRNLWGSRGTMQALQDLLVRETDADSLANAMFRGFSTLYAWSKFALVPLSPDSYNTNIIGGGVTEFMNGRLTMMTAGKGLETSPLTIGIKNWMRKTWPGWTSDERNRPHDTVYYAELDRLRGSDWTKAAKMLTPQAVEHIATREGIIDQSISMNEMLMDTRLGAYDDRQRKTSSLKKDGRMKRVKAFIAQMYGASDNAWKYNGLLHEAKVLAEAYPEREMSWIMREAGEKVKATTQMFNMIPEGVRTLSVFQLMPTFVAFRLELFRNVGNSVRIGMAESRSDNPVIRRNGKLRLAALATTLAASHVGLQFLFNLLRGQDEDEKPITDQNRQDFQRWAVGPWDRDEMIGIMSVKDGRMTYTNTSYLIPQSEITSVIRAAADGDDPMDAAISATANAASGFAFEGTVWDAIKEAQKEYRKHEQAVKRPGVGKPEARQFAATVSSLVDTLYTPGVVRKYQRMQKEGWFGDPASDAAWGRVYEKDEEIWRLISVRPSSVDLKENARWHAYDFHKRISDMKVKDADEQAGHAEDYKEFVRVMLRTYNLTPVEIRDIQSHTGKNKNMKIHKDLRRAAEEVFREVDKANKSK